MLLFCSRCARGRGVCALSDRRRRAPTRVSYPVYSRTQGALVDDAVAAGLADGAVLVARRASDDESAAAALRRVREEGARQGEALAASGMLWRHTPAQRAAAAGAAELAVEVHADVSGYIAMEAGWCVEPGRERFVEVCTAVNRAAGACAAGVSRIVGHTGLAEELRLATDAMSDGLRRLVAAAVHHDITLSLSPAVALRGGGSADAVPPRDTTTPLDAKLPLAAVAAALSPLSRRINEELLRDTPELGSIVAEFEHAVLGLQVDIEREEAVSAGAGAGADADAVGARNALAEVDEVDAANVAALIAREKRVAIAEQYILRIKAVAGARAAYARPAALARASERNRGFLLMSLKADGLNGTILPRLESAVQARLVPVAARVLMPPHASAQRRTRSARSRRWGRRTRRRHGVTPRTPRTWRCTRRRCGHDRTRRSLGQQQRRPCTLHCTSRARWPRLRRTSLRGRRGRQSGARTHAAPPSRRSTQCMRRR